MTSPRKSLGQHWLSDGATLDYIVNQAEVKPNDKVLEIGPGTGYLTKRLLAAGAEVIAVEKDEGLAAKLDKHERLTVMPGDILKFDLTQLPDSYKVVANIPYYLTSNLIKTLATSANPPAIMVLLVQKEVAERLCAEPGQLSVLAISAQLYYDCQPGKVVPAELFNPPPKVDSQVVVMKRRVQPLLNDLPESQYFKVVKAGFSARRKKLRSALAGGLGISREEVDQKTKQAGIDAGRRAQELTLEDWQQLAKQF